MSLAHDFESYRERIAALPDGAFISRDLLESETFLLERDDRTAIYYAPFDHVNQAARIALVGVTPGWTQMHTSFVEARAGIEMGDNTTEILRRVKRVAAFSGSLRTNLVAMLDGVEVPDALGVETTAELFEPGGEHMLHSTSAIRYPVFTAGKNCTGSSPSLVHSPFLSQYLGLLADELEIADRALVVPLGKAVEAGMRSLIDQGRITEDRCLLGIPHPSGANAHRAKQYKANRKRLRVSVAKWFSS